MATPKSTTTKKAPVKQTTKKAVVKKKTAPAVATQPKMRSFKLSPSDPSFKTFKITRQTVYWVLILSLIIFLQLLIISLQLDVSTLIEAQEQSLQDPSL